MSKSIHLPFIRRNNHCVLNKVLTTRHIVSQSNGFTMIESLFSLFVQLIIVTLIPLLLLSLANFKNTFANDESYTHELMVKEIGDQIHHPHFKSLMIKQNTLEVIHHHHVYTYRLSHLKIIKKVDGQGNITILNGVKKLQFTQMSKRLIQINMTYWQGRVWLEKSFIV
ncbi:competence type IV pilus minor pilin ComGF [Staphylococcus sp. 17KM0847]|uniref:competence type IV pilus minor pilin ComGF n=1 Tax=Staphylococcus sp. 17KM0847 TaxID=2583989 RepID=UPI0015DD2C1A|nr:competence type IV pilus minor pilin ComGF [Staphylococcus sp. 17KM0847]QLK86079.1 hypothetical protein FGL66_04815 [Staphylococcus sp. 17KM0847]